MTLDGSSSAFDALTACRAPLMLQHSCQVNRSSYQLTGAVIATREQADIYT